MTDQSDEPKPDLPKPVSEADREAARVAANQAQRPTGAGGNEPWRRYVGPDGSISPRPFGSWWGPI